MASRVSSLLPEQMSLLDQILAATTDHIYVFDRTGRYLYANPSGLAALGLKTDDVLGKSWRELNFPTDVMERHDAQRETVFQTGIPVQGEMSFPTVQGIRYYEYVISPALEVDGVIDAVTSTARDITEQKQAEDSLCRLTAELEARVQARTQELVDHNRSLRLDITERQKAEQALQDRESRFLELSEASPANIYIIVKRVDDSFYFEHISRAIETIHEIPAEQFLENANLIFESIHPEDRDSYLAKVQHSLETFNLFCHEWRVVNPSGTIKWVQGSSCPKLRDNGEIAWYGTVIDITDRKQAEAKLHEQEALLRIFAQYAPAGIAMFDREMRYVMASQRWVEDHNVDSVEFLIGQIHYEVIPEIPERWRQIHRRCLAGAIETCDEDLVVRTDGTQQWIRWEVRPWYTATDEIGGIIILAEDITARKQAEARFQERENLLHLFVQYAPVGIAMFDREMRYVMASQRWADDYHPGSPESFLGQLHYEVLPGIPDHYRQVHQRCLAGAIEQGEGWFLAANGSRQWTRWEVHPWYTASEEIGGIIIFSEEITQRKQAELALQELNQSLELRVTERTAELRASEAQIRAIVEAIPDLLLRVSRDGTCLDYIQSPNQADKSFSIQTHLSDMLPPDRMEQQLARVEQAIETGMLQIYEHQLQRENGFVYEEVRIVGINSDEALVIVRDISERRQTEHENHRLKERLQFLLTSSPAVIYARQPEADYRATYISSNIETVLGYPSEEFLTQRFWIDRIHPEDRERIFAALPALFELGTHHDEYRFLHRNGCYIWIRDELCLVRNEQGNPVEIVGYFADISDRKRAEESLQASQRFIQQIADASPNILYLYDVQEQRNIYSNRETATVLGYTPDQVQAMGSSFLQDLMHPDDLARLPQQREQINRSQDSEIVEFEYRMRQANGEWCWLYSRDAVFSRDAENRVQQIIGTAQDITHLKQIQQQLTERNEQLAIYNQELARATRLKDEFLASMSHELRTPLNAILGLTEGLQDQAFGEVNEQQISVLQTIEHTGLHLLELINDILDLAKVESGEIELDCAPTAVASLCQVSLDFIRQQALKKQIQIELKLPPTLPDLFVDERRIRQVLVNLLDNAVKFTPDRGRIKLEVSLPVIQQQREAEHNWLRFAVLDTGIGIASEDKDKLFRPFVQIDSALNRQYEGTGLGLALVKSLVELHGGQVNCTSEVGVGSCFIVDLPRVIVNSSAPESQPQADVTESNPPDQTAAPLLLLVEDNEDNIVTVASYLEMKGNRLLVARNGQEALALAQAEHPDLILMDIQMPGMDGLEAIRQIRLLPDLKHIPIIALTALAMAGDRERCLAAGASDYLSKPVRLKQLSATIQQLLKPAQA